MQRFAWCNVRSVSLAFAGTTDRPDLAPVFTDAALLANSVNYTLLAEGLVYPTFYSKLLPDLRTALTQAADTARATSIGVWIGDATTSGAQITTQDDSVGLPGEHFFVIGEVRV